MLEPTLTLRDIYRARATIGSMVRRTPLRYSSGLSGRSVGDVYLKLETAQETGAFKIRGAANRLLNLDSEQRARGVITVSTGNHGKAVAYVAKQMNMRAVICVPEVVLAHKVRAMRSLGAEIAVHGVSQDEAELYAIGLAEEKGLAMISPFDDPDVIAGQGTIGLEILEDLPHVDTVVVPMSGGGLISGIALALKCASPSIRIIGASMENGAVMYASLLAGKPVQLPEEPTLADSLVGGIGLHNRNTFAMVREFVDEVALLSEDEIAGAMVYALKEEHLVVEGGGSVGIGAVYYQHLASAGENIVVIVSGGNADMGVLASLLDRYDF